MSTYINRILGAFAVTLIILFIATTTEGQDPNRQPELLLPVPKIQFDSNAYRATVEESKTIRQLIDRL